MQTTALPASYDALGCELNHLTPRQLFDIYEMAGFLYPQKRARLEPYMAIVGENWRKALRGGELILWVLTRSEGDGAWSSVSSWRSTYSGWNSQHLVSLGEPQATRAVLLAAQAGFHVNALDDALQNWFSAANRYAARLFGTTEEALGPEHASVRRYDYLALPLAAELPDTSGEIRVEAWRPDFSPLLCPLAAAARGEVYVRAEQLDHDDALLEAVDDLYRLVGLRRYRRICLAFLPGRKRPAGAIIAYRGPLGLNFSFLENRCDLLIADALDEATQFDVAAALLRQAQQTYADFEPRQVFLTVDPRQRQIIERLGATLLREYCQSIWLRESFLGWYRHAERFFDRVHRTGRRRGFGGRKTHQTTEVQAACPQAQTAT